MKAIKLLTFSLLIIFYILGACGCMNNKDYSDKILSELEKKYNITFEIEKLTLEFSGDLGKYYRAVCKESGQDKTFVAVYYDDKNELYDEYCGLRLNEDLVDYLISSDLGIEHAVVDIITVKHALTVDDIDRGVEYCLSNEDFDVKVSAYIFLDQSILDNTDIENKLVDKFTELKIYRCNLDVVYMSSDSLALAKNEYKDVYKLDYNLEKDTRIIEYRRYNISADFGTELTEIVKGE